jgi:hypothetical protein
MVWEVEIQPFRGWAWTVQPFTGAVITTSQRSHET